MEKPSSISCQNQESPIDSFSPQLRSSEIANHLNRIISGDDAMANTSTRLSWLSNHRNSTFTFDNNYDDSNQQKSPCRQSMSKIYETEEFNIICELVEQEEKLQSVKSLGKNEYVPANIACDLVKNERIYNRNACLDVVSYIVDKFMCS